MASNRTLGDAQSVLNSFRCLVRSLRLADRAGLREHGLGASQLYVLHELQLGRGTVGELVHRRRRLPPRERSETDARRIDLTLTARGHAPAKRRRTRG